MSTTDYRDLLEEARQSLNAGDVDAYIDLLYAPDALLHSLPPEAPRGREGVRLFYRSLQAAFPDMQLHVDDTVLDGDQLATRFRAEMTHLGEFMGVPATGKRVTISGITIMRFANGQVAERWSQADFLGLMQQIGVA